MELRLDRSKKYALALEGGGGRGAYEIGAWKALHEEGIEFCAVAGTSVGAINGAVIAEGALDKAIALWRKVTYSDVMNVDDSVMTALMRMDIHRMDIKQTAKTLSETLKNKGFDITPLKTTLMKSIDERAVMESPIEFYIVTFSVDDMKGVVARAKDLAPGELYEMILASAFLPLFRSERLRGKRYLDGGSYNRLPVSTLLDRGYRDIIAIEMNSIGPIRSYEGYDGSDLHFIKPVRDLGGLIQFEPSLSERNLTLGYYDAKKMMYGLSGRKYYLERTMTDGDAYALLSRFINSYCRHSGIPCSMRLLNEKHLPALASRVRAAKTDDYYTVLICSLETAAEAAGIDPFRIVTDQDLLKQILKVYDPASGNIPKAFTRTLPSFPKR